MTAAAISMDDERDDLRERRDIVSGEVLPESRLLRFVAAPDGAVVPDVAAKLPEAAELCGRRETPILEIARSPDFSLEKLKDALKRSAEIH